MVSTYNQLIDVGYLRLRRAPHQNTISDWSNDRLLLPVLFELVRYSTLPFRQREVACIIDSSKFSQMSTAHSRGVEYLNDERPDADWMKCHLLVGVETTVVMAVAFSGSKGVGSHDINFLKPLVAEACRTFPLQFLLGDKAYYGEHHLNWLWNEYGIRAFIPVKKNIIGRATNQYEFNPVADLIQRYDGSRRDFQEVYRLRPKIEGFFSMLKRLADDYCWSRGRPRDIKNADDPCTAWKIETLCKIIFMNLRATVTLQEETGYQIDYPIEERFFPPPAEPLIAAA